MARLAAGGNALDTISWLGTFLLYRVSLLSLSLAQSHSVSISLALSLSLSVGVAS